MCTFTKLKSGDWGLRGKNLKSGASVTVTKKSGETQTVVVGKIIWTGDDGTCIATLDASTKRRKYHDPNFSSGGCSACARLGYFCKQCEFDEYDN